jgi:glycopeptide antibiotics resistance protein
MFALLLKNKWRTAFLAYTLYIIYGTTLPFKFTLSRTVIHQQMMELLSFSHYLSLPSSTVQIDGISNILFFIPFGYFLINTLLSKQKKEKLKFLLLRIIISGALLSLFVEVLQVFTVNRSPSLLDVITNTFGTYIGAYVGFTLRKKGYHNRIKKLFTPILNNSDIFIITVYIFYVISASLAPFNFNLSPFRIYGNLDSLKTLDFTFQSTPIKIWGILYVFAPAGYIIARSLRRFVNWSQLVQTSTTIIIGFVLCFFIEILQLFVNSRHFSWSDIYLGWIGVLYGLASYQMLHNELFGKNIRKPWAIRDPNPRLYYFFILNYLIFLLYKFLYPFEFSGSAVLEKLYFFSLNLFSYIPSKDLIELLIILVKNFIMFVPAGIILSENNTVYKRKWVFWALAFFILFAKSFQLFNIHQAPLLYDLIGMSIGFTFGYIFWNELKKFLMQPGKLI